ncbi:MAG: excinuclease ABC subunit UvrA [Deltaproteobacteria bacterium]|nr:excinuclease ABC subunit UvrA [Deltaproteobacteria bacterium]
MEKHNDIILENVRTHNLKGIDVRFPLNKLTVVTGVSGSGKSSLVFDTLYAESYRRFVDSLSSYARQYLKALPKPEVEGVSNLPPAIALKQSRPRTNQRSTVGSLTELNHLVQTLFTHLSKVFCYSCGEAVEKDTPRSIVEKTIETLQGEEIFVTAPLHVWKGLKGTALKTQLQEQGFARVWENGQLSSLEHAKASEIHNLQVIVDRLSLASEEKGRLTESVSLALKVGKGFCKVLAGKRMLAFSSTLECLKCGIAYLPPSMALFSFNHPLGACDTCQGYGRISELDWDKVFPDLRLSIANQGIAPLNFGRHVGYYDDIRDSARKKKIDIRKPFAKFTSQEWSWLKEGDGKFGGMNAYFEWLNSKKYKAHYRIHAARFHRYETCTVCEGKRFCRESLAYKVGGKNLAEVHRQTVSDFDSWLRSEVLLSRDGNISPPGLEETIDEIRSRLHYLMKIGVAYLSLDRVTHSLSGGEWQRIHMASCIGSSLTDTLYCLDEPTSGLHAHDSRNLLETIHELRDQGNTVVVVEHDRVVIDGADKLIALGPGAGHLGGHIVGEGGQEVDPYPERQAKEFLKFLRLTGAKTHNLQNIDIEIPLGALTVVCGVSGSGKTSLVQHTLYPMFKDQYKMALIDQKGLGRSSRSNIATYLGVFEPIRKLFAKQERAKELKLGPGSFSFNIQGGRCEVCKGLGTVTEDLSFLGEVTVGCPQCEGRRFSAELLSVRYRGRNLLDVLGLTVAQALEVFFDHAEIRTAMQAVLDLGLGYLTLGQATSSFSGGEAQRLKLLSLLKEVEEKESKTKFLIFDEPTTGLADADVRTLWNHLAFLTQRGHTVLVIEHHLDMIRNAEWLIELGPGAADAGGRLVYQGPPEGLHDIELSKTAPFLRKTKG